MEIRIGSLDFSSPISGSGPRSAAQTLVFPRTVKTAATGLTGYTVAYSGSDHHVGRLEVHVEPTINSNTVTVSGTLGVRDWSGNWDDQYDGVIDFAVVAELESVVDPPPRGDVIVTGVELNQAVQFFRSDRFLDPANVRPDNSIWLIARKNTGVRVYVDWDASAGLPPISRLTGQLTLHNSATTVNLQPINLSGTIAPKRDVQINQALANDTLNFMIPAAWCAGEVEITCQVWDQASPGSKSAAFTRTLVFVAVQPLNLFLVGVNLTNIPAAAPTQAAITSALSLLVKTYPRGDILQTGFTAINFGETVGGVTTSGCGRGFSDLLDRLKDLRGGSNDIYFGALPAGVATSGVVGCSPVGDGVAAAFVDIPLTIPHEVGHSLGRTHDPCRGCVPPAQDPDSNYPQYDNFNSDSIGVFGFDPTTNTVFNPASTRDFMTAFLPSVGWVSPYTYQGLLSGAVGGPAPGAPSALIDARGSTMTLFLGLVIDRQRNVTRRPSFTFQAPLQGGAGCESEFTLEILDERREVLDCGPLHCHCMEGNCGCWPKVLRDSVPMPEGARWLLVWEGGDKIYEEEIPDPPTVEITGTEMREEGMLLKWASDPAEGLWYAVHYFDKRHEVYRGVAPRLQETSLVLPRSLFADGPDLQTCVLATSGIATGRDCANVVLEDYTPQDPHVVLREVDMTLGSPQQIPNVLTVVVTDVAGQQLSSDRTAWYDARGAEIARGSHLDLRSLGPGRHVIRTVLRGLGGQTVARSWLIERTREGCLFHHVICDPEPKQVQEEHQHPHSAPRPCE